MASNYNNDDEFDWEAALTEIESACNKMELPLVHDNISCKINSLPLNASDDDNNIIPKSSVDMKQQKCNKLGKIPLKLPKTVRQGTLDRFVNLRNGPIGHESLNQDLSKAQTVSTCEECIELGVKSEIDPEKAETWTYPVNIPLRDYQFSIAKTALFSNTLVVLPTGLGKTLIAAVVMYNYFRWFPSGKIVFTAPSRPLVMQQIEACHNIVGIPQEYTIDMTGQMNPAQRLMYWQSKRVFFVTPQVLEKDIQSGSCMAEELVCLVVDEAHRAVGNYSYCVVVREIMAVPVQLRIVALTATPGSKQASIQLVIDNLHISTLEHRSETDPDVVPYTHNREIEMIPVVINKETLTISTLLLEVAQPVIQRLCSLGVFYNRDVSKVTPFELLTARDKFRQSPPPLLGESQYGEVEGCFGGAITVYHIYKLLFSHGVRPALEMLHQKLQQGSFARLMGRNEKLWQAKLLMQQSVSHGAPNPKLLRMEEIISEHFDAKDPSSTRVIIFTNFRESVKDIMESLFKLNDAVRAVEFIGQSSGKSSKGQTQKVQQEVLQKFRLGDYNTIVATSIGEEGLDIMEVDLVICFDANVSPLRMVQRIGRTGRKRDGRVVILASEGSELQGYLKKKAKEIALRKHMHNGGTRSFMFHASPRMVPHCYQPQVQFVEMSIKKFVPRGRRLKAGCGQSDLGRDGLVDDEKYLLEKYFGHSCQDDWKPSLIAFPHYQSFPSCIFKVKHSFRTTKMLIGTSQALQSHTCRLDFQGTKVTPSLVDVMNCQEYMEDDLLFQEQLMKNREYFSQGSHHQSHNQSIQDQVKEKYLEVTSPLSSLYRDENTEEEDTTRIKQLAESKVVQKNMNRKSLSSSVNVSGHQCLYNTGFVSVNTGGNVVIASIPCFPSSTSVSDIPDHLPSEAMIEKAKVNANSVNSTKENSTSVIPERVHISGTESLPQMPCRQEAVVNACDEGIAEETSEEGENKNSYRSHEIIFDSFAHISMESPPRNKENKNSNSPESEVQVQRCNSSSFGTQTESVLVSRRVDNDIQFLKENTSIISPTVSLKCVGSTPQVTNHFGKGILAGYPFGHASGDCALGTSLKKNDSDVLKDSTNLPTLNSSEILNASLKNNNANNVEMGTQVCKMMPEKQGSIPFDGSKSLATNHILCNEEKPLSLECSRIWNDFSAEAKHTPLDTKSNCSQDWNLTINGNEQCAQRPRKFKRLRKFKDEKENSSKMEANRTHLHTVGASIHKKLKIPKANQRFKTSAVSFLDDEAEVSSDEEVSTEEDDLEESCSDTASDSFIDDSIQESISKRSEDDMLAVYRRSLLTPSPSTNQLKCFSCLESPVNDETGNLDPSISVDASSDSFLLSTSKSNATECASSHIQVKDNKSVVSIKGHHPDQESREVNLICNINMTSNTVEFRKRKLMFQDINSVELSRCDESSASFVTLNVPLPKNGNDVSEVSHQNESLMACLDDDLFMGIDPDALEAEAIELARQRAIKPKGVEGMPPGNGCLLNENASNSYVFHQEKCLASGNSNRSQNDGTIFSKPYLITEGMQKMSIEHEDADIDVLCTPSFDLGV